MSQRANQDIGTITSETVVERYGRTKYQLRTRIEFPDRVSIDKPENQAGPSSLNLFQITTHTNYDPHFCETQVFAEDEWGMGVLVYPIVRRPLPEVLDVHVETIEMVKSLYTSRGSPEDRGIESCTKVT